MPKIDAVAMAVLIVIFLASGIVAVTSDSINKPIHKPVVFKILKDPVTKCQYIISGNAMFPRLDARRVHICSDENIYKFPVERD